MPKKQKTKSATCKKRPRKNNNVSLKSSSKVCKKRKVADCFTPVTDDTDNESDKYCFLVIGEHENQVAEGGEESLTKCMKYCKKNPGHPKFIPIYLFSLKHLPEGHQKSDLYEFIKATADLTVKLSVTMTSPNRPKFFPNTERPYHLYHMRGKKTLRTGSGIVNSLIKFTDEDKHWNFDYTTCPCNKCKTTDKPSTVWWEVCAKTAAHVVFDDIEASHTTLRLFYDREDSEIVILDDRVLVEEVKINEDWCSFSFVTCDENLAKKLEKMKERFVQCWGKVYHKYLKIRDIYKLNFIVSHPHGCSKMVSVGQWKEKVEVGDYDNEHQFTYTTCTCPGSSGANVQCLGYSSSDEHVHSGSLKTGLNYSGVGQIFQFN